MEHHDCENRELIVLLGAVDGDDSIFVGVIVGVGIVVLVDDFVGPLFVLFVIIIAAVAELVLVDESSLFLQKYASSSKPRSMFVPQTTSLINEKPLLVLA